jgi:hypothetical protein
MARNLSRTPHPAAGADLARLPNLGPASAAMLVGAGVADVRTLRALGPARAFRRVLFAREGRVSRNLLWALEAALSGQRWDRLDADTRARLLREVEAEDA